MADTIQLQIDALNERLTTINHQVTTEANNIEEHVIEARQEVNNIAAKNRLQDSQLSYMEEEIHMIAAHMDTSKADISYVKARAVMNTDLISEISDVVTSYEATNIDDHNELHEECRLLSYAIGDATDRLDRASYMMNQRRKVVVIPEADYESISYKDANVLYFTYDPTEDIDV